MSNTENIRKKIKLFCIGVFSLIFLWLLAARGLKLKGILTSSAAYQDRIAALGPVDPARLAELAAYRDSLRESPPELQSPDSGEFPASSESADPAGAGPEMGMEAIRELLRAAGIRGERLRFGGREGDGTAELSLRCETVKFFSFLAELSGHRGRPVTYLSIRAVPGSRDADITMRLKYE
ncbi:MAG: hypothetical protein LBP80_09365 [Treponema sp.]|jgi:hypothetical protein|nr:hypothetical protein [Treponema sp.]